MAWIYAIGINIFKFLIWVAAGFHPKAKLFHRGRQNLLQKIAREWTHPEQAIWFHFASLGEFEQGRPVLEEIKKRYPNEKILITFFSPSGYEIRKNYTLADAVYYLPLDTPQNAFQFVDLIRPKMAIFTKYEFWPNYFKALHANQVPLFLISAIFRPDQVFFKFYGGFYRSVLKAVTYFFVQNKESQDLLAGIGFKNVAINGDTRLDSVFNLALHLTENEIATIFKADSPVLVAGSTWAPDEKIIAAFIQANPKWKCILAPHEVNDTHIKEILAQFKNAITYSESKNLSPTSIAAAQVLVIDNIGLLSKLYPYGKIAYIGGGFGVGIHNTLEAAAYGIPVFFGPKHQKFQEAQDLLRIGAAASIKNSAEFQAQMQALPDSPAGQRAAQYVQTNKGATTLILAKIEALNLLK
ncbi:MAG: 3-deoxy-D-manno-octulosonic acid transferase [Pedobacter sp.]|nr:MAG: 3-deoxy-D-manno-octulosonic acid transferase [Pedobacter sp.]